MIRNDMKIDRLAYELCGLTDEEIQIVEDAGEIIIETSNRNALRMFAIEKQKILKLQVLR